MTVLALSTGATTITEYRGCCRCTVQSYYCYQIVVQFIIGGTWGGGEGGDSFFIFVALFDGQRSTF
jgi:hypothetical protein